jgi:hypothetical protein
MSASIPAGQGQGAYLLLYHLMRQRMPVFLDCQLWVVREDCELTKYKEPLVLCQLVIPVYQIMS